MTISAHIDALHGKHAQLDAALDMERARPLPDFATIAELKKRKLLLKEEILALQATVPKRKKG